MKPRSGFLMVTAVATVSLLSGCNGLDTPSQVNEERIQIESGVVAQEVPVADLNETGIRALQQEYQRYGSGAAEVTVMYDPHSRSNTAMKASGEAARISDLMRKNGFDDVQTGIMPVREAGDTGKALITYQTATAHAPAGCTEIPNFGPGQDIDLVKDYRFGCEVETMLVRQVARPADLLGKGGLDAADGRRTSNVLGNYRNGTPNEALNGESASGSN